METTYFAALPAKELANHVFKLLEKKKRYVETAGLADKWKKSYQFYYGKHFTNLNSYDGSDIVSYGEDGQLSAFSVNHFRNLIRHVLSLTTSQRPAFEPKAINADVKSLKQTVVARSLLDAYLSEKKMGRYLKTAAERALVVGEGYMMMLWEPSLGRPQGVQTIKTEEGDFDSLVYEGDVDITNPSHLDVLTDKNEIDWSKKKWVNVTVYLNKHDLAARYPEHKEKILTKDSAKRWDSINYTFHNDHESDLIPVEMFYHVKSPALPNGRYMFFIDESCVLFDGDMPYKRLPVFRIIPGEVFETGEGYTEAFDLLGPQEAFNTILSSIFTGCETFGVQNVLIPNGSNVTAEQLSKQLAAIKYDPTAGKPEALQLMAVPQELFQFAQLMVQSMQLVSGVNSVTRGDPDSSLKSGTALALVQSMAIQFSSAFQESWANLLEDGGTFLIDLFKSYAKSPRLYAMAGKHQRGYMDEFTGDDLANISRVSVELGNPLMRTVSGKLQIAEHLLTKGIIKTADQYLTVLNTGVLEPLTDGTQAQLLLVKQENDDLTSKKQVIALVSDNHRLHIQEHLAILSNSIVRRESDIVGDVLNHVKEHLDLFKSQDPLYSILQGEAPVSALSPQQSQMPVGGQDMPMPEEFNLPEIPNQPTPQAVIPPPAVS